MNKSKQTIRDKKYMEENIPSRNVENSRSKYAINILLNGDNG